MSLDSGHTTIRATVARLGRWRVVSCVCIFATAVTPSSIHDAGATTSGPWSRRPCGKACAYRPQRLPLRSRSAAG